MSPSNFSDRRRNSRIPLVISVRERSETGIVMCVATDISPCGMALKRAANSIIEKPVTLDFQLPGMDGVVSVTARFVRQVQTASVQVGAVAFERVPEQLLRWFSSVQATAASVT